MLGFDTKKKVKICIMYFVLPTIFLVQLTNWKVTADFFTQFDVRVADLWLIATFAVVFGRVFFLWHQYGFITSMHWFLKFVTDPFTNIPAYWRSAYQIFSPRLLRYALSKSFPSTVSPPADLAGQELDMGNGWGPHGQNQVAKA